MAALRSWISSLAVLTLLLSTLRTLTPEGTLQRVGSFTGGLVLLLALLRPLSSGKFTLPEADWDAWRSEAEALRERWDAETRRELAARVAEGTEDAIREQAARMGLTLWAEAELRWEGDVPLPWRVTLHGGRDGGMERWIAENLDIPLERQVWADAPPVR